MTLVTLSEFTLGRILELRPALVSAMSSTPDLTQASALLIIGIIFGLISTLAGGGSIVTLPALLYLGVSPHAANATNRVVGVVQTLSAAWSFRRGGVLSERGLGALLGYAALGGVVGASSSLLLTPDAMRTGIHLCLIAVALFTLGAPRRLFVEPPPRARSLRVRHLGVFIVGFYGGFLQAGIGLVTLYYVRFICGYDLVRGTALKTLLIIAMIGPAFAIFIWWGEVRWWLGLYLALGSIAGARIAVSLSLSPSGARWIRAALPCTAILMILNLIGRSLR